MIFFAIIKLKGTIAVEENDKKRFPYAVYLLKNQRPVSLI